MKLIRSLIASSLLAGITPGVAFADCNPACRGQKVCRYDSTRNPQFYCHKPPVAASQSSQWVNSVEFPAAKSNTPKAATKWDGAGGESAKSAKPTPVTGTSTPKRASDPNAQYNPKEIGIDKVKK